jgi:membrane protease subunit HflK
MSDNLQDRLVGAWSPGNSLDDIIALARSRLPRFTHIPGVGLKMLAVVVLLFVIGWMATGIYKVQPDELGLVLQFGKWVRTSDPGLNYHLPYPIETILLPKVTQVNQVKVGSGITNQMLTGDENIVEADATVFWKIRDPVEYMFKVYDPEGVVKVAAESAIREVIGRNPIQAALSDRRQEIADQAQQLLQSLLDANHAGILVTQVQLQRVDPPELVIDAFNDVQRARADQERARNEAEAYSNDILPRARGEVARMKQDAEAYKSQVISLARGEAGRFLAVYGAYKEHKDVIAERLYIETMEEVLKNASKVILDASGEGRLADVVPYLSLPEGATRLPAAAPAPIPARVLSQPPASSPGAVR